jgi:hypothetical protein
MKTFKKITHSNFFIKLTNWEYWPFGILQFPIIVYYLWLSLRSRSLVFFSASNPGIAMGGMFGESKYDVLRKIPTGYIARTILVDVHASKEEILKKLQTEGFTLPVIFKPELGERGHMVKRISSEEDIEWYLKNVRINFLVQELIDLPIELGVFYTRLPLQKNGSVTSVVKKEMLSVTGNGKATLQQLILGKDRAKLQWEKLRKIFKDRLDEVVEKGTTIELVSIGNHALGTKFLNGNDLIDDRLSKVFDQISKGIDGFYFGRFDIRTASLDDLYAGNIKILELNGCGAEPAHIYDPDFRLYKAVAVLLKHWRNIFEIARENHKLGIEFISHKEALYYYKRFKAAK